LRLRRARPELSSSRAFRRIAPTSRSKALAVVARRRRRTQARSPRWSRGHCLVVAGSRAASASRCVRPSLAKARTAKDCARAALPIFALRGLRDHGIFPEASASRHEVRLLRALPARPIRRRTVDACRGRPLDARHRTRPRACRLAQLRPTKPKSPTPHGEASGRGKSVLFGRLGSTQAAFLAPGGGA
jgi:hypothetical protein